jgi:hypothetical protein
MGTDNGLLHWPPRENADYERESMDALGEWELERRIRELDRDIDRMECEAWDLECDLKINEAAGLLDIVVQKRTQYRELKHQLDELTGGW